MEPERLYHRLRADLRPTRWITDLVTDARVAVRNFGRAPLFTLICVCTLALGIGANTAIFSAADALLVQPLPYRDSDRVVFTLGWDLPSDEMRFNVRASDWVTWRDTTRSFEAVSGYRPLDLRLTGDGQPARLQGYRVTPNTFPLLGVEPLLGRGFRESDGVPGAPDVVVLGHPLWQTRYAADPTIIGRRLILDDRAVTVIGVMPVGFAYPQFNFAGDLWLPLSIDAAALQADRQTSFSMVSVARLRPDISLGEAQAELSAIYSRLETDHPQTNAGLGVRVTPMQQLLADQLLSPLLLVMAAVAVVLLIVCANVASLLLARASVRTREMAIRSALGAGRFRLLRQLLTEAVLLATVGGGLGVLLTLWGLGALQSAIPEFVASTVPAVREIGVDLRVLTFSAGVSLLATLLFGLAPAVTLSKTAGAGRLARGTGRSPHRVLSGLVVAEVALSTALLVGAGLTTRSLWNVLQVEPGFDPRALSVLDLTMPASRYPDAASRASFLEQVIAGAQTLPGVEAAAVVNPCR